MDDPQQQGQPEREGFFGAARLVAALTLGSRLLGLARDMAIVAFGATRAMDCFWTAFKVPNAFRRLFGEGALSAAFVPVFTQVAEAEGWERARLVLANCAGLLAVLLAGVVVLIELALVAALGLAPGGEDRRLLLQLTGLMLPFTFTVCLLALGSAALNCKGHFAYPAFAPILLNVFLILAAYVAHTLPTGAGHAGLFVLGGAVLLTGAVQIVGVVWLLRSVGLAVVPSLRPVLPATRRVARLALPMLVPLGVMQLSSLFDSFYAWIMTETPAAPRLEFLGLSIAKPLGEGVVTCLYAAERLYNFPLGVLAISLATVVFPLFSRYATRGDSAGLREATNRAVRLSLFMGVPAGVGLMVLAHPAVTLVYRHGQFTAAAAGRSALILQMYALGMWAYFCRHILLRAFFCQQDARTPLKVSCWLAGLNVLLVVVGVFTPLRGGAIGLATALTAGANVGVLGWVLHRRWGGLGLAGLLRSLGRTAAATATMASALLTVQALLAPLANRLAASAGPKAGAAVVLAAALPAGLVAFFAAARLLRCGELAELLRRRGRGAADS